MEYCGILSFLDLFGVAVFAISGMLTAGRKKLDIFGAVVVATVTAIGGGTLRDMLLGEPVFWLQKPIYLWVIPASAAFSPVFLHQKKPPTRAILIADAFGLAVFSITGAAVANQKGFPIILVLVIAIMTGAAGGLCAGPSLWGNTHDFTERNLCYRGYGWWTGFCTAGPVQD